MDRVDQVRRGARVVVVVGGGGGGDLDLDGEMMIGNASRSIYL